MSERKEIDYNELHDLTIKELNERIDDCRRRILAEFGIEWKPEAAHADE